ncbi:MAG TPA: hypothetical protein VMS64_12480 [Candidatus Methylomirabilis sp.]|nr:hypothetical protein [Candidatus Methylomirabilis sp.]
MIGLLALVGVVGGVGRLAAQSSSPPSSAAPAPTAATPAPTATAPATPDADVEKLRERAAEFWAARIAGDANAQWQLLEPRGKGRSTAEEYGARPTGGRYLAYQVEDATVKGYFGTVKVRLIVQQILPSPGSRNLPPQATTLEDGWIRIKGVWYRRWEAGQ